MPSPREELVKALKRHRALSFPEGSPSDELVREFHAQLAEYDALVFGLAESVSAEIEVDRKQLEPSYEMKTSARKLDAQGRDTGAARRHVEYFEQLEDLRELARLTSHGFLEVTHPRRFPTDPHDERFVRELIASNLGAAGLLTDHLSGEADEVLPYLLLADIARELLNVLGGEPSELDETTALGILEFVENQYEKASPTRNLIAVGFLESLEAPNPASARLPNLLGPNLKADFSPWAP